MYMYMYMYLCRAPAPAHCSLIMCLLNDDMAIYSYVDFLYGGSIGLVCSVAENLCALIDPFSLLRPLVPPEPCSMMGPACQETT